MMAQWKRRVEQIMHESAKGPPSTLAAMLQTASVLYGGAVKLRSTCYDAGILPAKRLPCRVISVGNITAGGTGKTPMTIHLARRLKQAGHRPAILSRGYGGKAEHGGAVVSDGHHLLSSPEVAGDEPFMMAAALKETPVLVGGDRYNSGLRAVAEFDPDILILDDAFQHRRLYRDIDLVLVDARRSFGNGYLVPRGMLREPISGLHRADAVVLTRSSGRTGLADLIGSYIEKPVYRADHEPYLAGIFAGETPPLLHAATIDDTPAGFKSIEASTAFVFSGIAQNREFVRMMESRVGRVAGVASFPDHHRYTEAELARLVREARDAHADLFVTTEKDYVRIAGRVPGDLPIAVIGVRIGFCDADDSAFLEFIRQRLLSANRNM